jgi:hypothetical protein
MTDHKIVKYSVILGGRCCIIIKENKVIYVVKGGNLRQFFFSLIDDYRLSKQWHNSRMETAVKFKIKHDLLWSRTVCMNDLLYQNLTY